MIDHVQTVRYITGDVFETLAAMPDGSVDMVMTSPPFLALRSYLPADHPHKHLELGSEPDPATFIDMLLGLTAELRRVVAPWGSIAVELGDTYSGSGGAGGDYGKDGMRAGQVGFDGSAARRRSRTYGVANLEDSCRPGTASRLASGAGWPIDKSKTLIPELYRVGLTYGLNPLTGQPSAAGRWITRNVVTWCRTNPPPGSLGDKMKPATSDIVIAATSGKRWFDNDAGRSITGAPPLDYIVLSNRPYPGSHYAVYPADVCRTPIDSCCPREVCTVCGEPRRRIYGETSYVPSATYSGGSVYAETDRLGGKVNQHRGDKGSLASMIAVRETLGWSDCGHGSFRPGIVLDPFGGSGTTGMVAAELGRDAILIDLDERNVELARERIGPHFIHEPTLADMALHPTFDAEVDPW